MTSKIPPTYVYFIVSNDDGSCGRSFSIEVKYVNFHGANNDGIWVDFYYLDGTAERRLISGRPYGNFTMGPYKDRIISFRIQATEPATEILTKDEFHARAGIERLLNERGHFAEVGEQPTTGV